MEHDPEEPPGPRYVTHDEFVRQRAHKLLRRSPPKAPVPGERIRSRRTDDRESRAQARETQAVVCALLGFFIFPPLMIVAAFMGRRLGRSLAIFGIVIHVAVWSLIFTARAKARAAPLEIRSIDARICLECGGQGFANYESHVRMQCRACGGTGLRKPAAP